MTEREQPIAIPEGSQVTPEEQRRIEESGREFQADKARAKASREKQKQPEGRPFTGDTTNRKILEGQQKRILRAKIDNLAGGVVPLPSDFAKQPDHNDYAEIRRAKAKNFWERVKNLFG